MNDLKYQSVKLFSITFISNLCSMVLSCLSKDSKTKSLLSLIAPDSSRAIFFPLSVKNTRCALLDVGCGFRTTIPFSSNLSTTLLVEYCGNPLFFPITACVEPSFSRRDMIVENSGIDRLCAFSLARMLFSTMLAKN